MQLLRVWAISASLTTNSTWVKSDSLHASGLQSFLCPGAWIHWLMCCSNRPCVCLFRGSSWTGEMFWMATSVQSTNPRGLHTPKTFHLWQVTKWEWEREEGCSKLSERSKTAGEPVIGHDSRCVELIESEGTEPASAFKGSGENDLSYTCLMLRFFKLTDMKTINSKSWTLKTSLPIW